jgi:hypothetical protein
MNSRARVVDALSRRSAGENVDGHDRGAGARAEFAHLAAQEPIDAPLGSDRALVIAGKAGLDQQDEVGVAVLDFEQLQGRI